MNRVTLTLLAVIVFLLLALLTCNTCKNKRIAELEGKPAKEVVKTERKTDTVWQHSRDTFTRTITHLKPYAVIRHRTDTLIEYLEARSEAETALYSDSVAVQYGKVYINDTLQNNRIQGRSVVTAFNVPVVTNTITRTTTERRVKGFLTGTVQGSYQQPFGAIGGGFMLQFKNSNAVEVSALFDRLPGAWQGQQFQLSYKHKISLR